MRKPVRIENASEDFRRLNPQLFVTQGYSQNTSNVRRIAVSPERRMNKTEARFLDVLVRLYPDGLIIPQPTRLFRFENKDSYTPDFVVIDKGAIIAYEVKGGYRGAGWEQGYERFHRAKEAFRKYQITFILATWNTKQKQWEYEL